jgi:hypothetical protein
MEPPCGHQYLEGWAQNIIRGSEHRPNNKEQNGENVFIRKGQNINTAAHQEIAIDLRALESVFNSKWILSL